ELNPALAADIKKHKLLLVGLKRSDILPVRRPTCCPEAARTRKQVRFSSSHFHTSNPALLSLAAVDIGVDEFFAVRRPCWTSLVIVAFSDFDQIPTVSADKKDTPGLSKLSFHESDPLAIRRPR